MKTCKRLLALLAAFSLVLALMPAVTVNAVNEDKDNYEIRYAYTMNTFDSTEKMQKFTAWYENGTEEYFYPEYFAGFKTLEDGSLAFLVTDDSDTIKNTVKSIVGEDISFIKVEHSFNELYQAERKFWENIATNNSPSLRTSLNLQENVIDVYLDEAESVNIAIPYSEMSLFHIQDDSKWKEKAQNISEGITPLTDEELGLGIETTAARASSINVYPGLKTAFDNPSMTDGGGTIGFCTTDKYGNRIAVTHGHDIQKDATFFAYTSNSATTKKEIGYVKKSAWSTASVLDYSIVQLNANSSSLTINTSNNINNSSRKINIIVAKNYVLKSYNGNRAYIHGSTSGEMSGTLDISDDMGMEGMINTLIYIDGMTSDAGDSGAPIFLKYTTQATLLGIIKGNDKRKACGNTIEMITNDYPDLDF